MIDWLRPEQHDPVLEFADRTLPIEPVVHPRARRMILRLASDGASVRVTYPPFGRRADAIRFARSKKDWIARQVERLPVPGALLARGSVRYRGATLSIRHDPAGPRAVTLADGAVSAGGPEASLAGRLERWLKVRALDAIERDAAFYCRRAGVSAPPCRLSGAKRRWGSCSAKGVVRVNWRLIQAPDEIRRSVVAHEIAHLVHFDHSPAFHALLAELFEGDTRTSDAWLKTHGRSLYTDFG